MYVIIEEEMELPLGLKLLAFANKIASSGQRILESTADKTVDLTKRAAITTTTATANVAKNLYEASKRKIWNEGEEPSEAPKEEGRERREDKASEAINNMRKQHFHSSARDLREQMLPPLRRQITQRQRSKRNLLEDRKINLNLTPIPGIQILNPMKNLRTVSELRESVISQGIGGSDGELIGEEGNVAKVRVTEEDDYQPIYLEDIDCSKELEGQIHIPHGVHVSPIRQQALGNNAQHKRHISKGGAGKELFQSARGGPHLDNDQNQNLNIIVPHDHDDDFDSVQSLDFTAKNTEHLGKNKFDWKFQQTQIV